MSKPDLEQVRREGPLPKVDDDSELVGQEERENRSGVAKEHGADFVTIPMRGAGAYPMPTAGDTPLPAPDVAADENENPDADPEQRER